MTDTAQTSSTNTPVARPSTLEGIKADLDHEISAKTAELENYLGEQKRVNENVKRLRTELQALTSTRKRLEPIKRTRKVG
jgi:hypothetical protein